MTVLLDSTLLLYNIYFLFWSFQTALIWGEIKNKIERILEFKLY